MSINSIMLWIAHTFGILFKTLSQYAAILSGKLLAVSDNTVTQSPSEDERARLITQYESEKATLQRKIDQLQPPKEEQEPTVEKEKVAKASPSTVAPKQPKGSLKKSKKNIVDDDVLSFQQKKEMSKSIGKLDGARLERVIQIIQEGVPEIRDSTEEIELEINDLPVNVLTKLYNYVVGPNRPYAQSYRSTEDERARLISQSESEKAALQRTIDQLRLQEEEELNVEKEKVPQASPSTVAAKQPKGPLRKSKKHIADDDVLSYQQKKEMSDSICNLDSARLERVIQIIHDGVPWLRDSTEEIELDIDQLPATVLTKLYNYIVRQNTSSSARAGGNRTGKSSDTRTGGSKRHEKKTRDDISSSGSENSCSNDSE